MIEWIKKTMFAIFANPIVAKEIKQRTRGLRFSFTVAGWLFVMSMFTALYLKSVARPVIDLWEFKSSIYMFCSFLVFLFAGFFGLLITILCSQAIAKERENQTLDILLSTPLTNFEMVIGKMIAAAGEAVMLFISSIPVFVLLYFYGITSMTDILLIFLYVFVLILFYGSLALLLSTVIKKSIPSTVIVILVVVLTTILGYIFVMINQQVGVYSSGQTTANKGFWNLLSISVSSALALTEFVTVCLQSGTSIFLQYSYKIRGYQVHFIICALGTVLNILLSTLFLNPLRRISLFKRKPT